MDDINSINGIQIILIRVVNINIFSMNPMVGGTPDMDIIKIIITTYDFIGITLVLLIDSVFNIKAVHIMTNTIKE